MTIQETKTPSDDSVLFNFSVELYRSDMTFTSMEELERAGTLTAKWKNLFAKANVTLDGRIHPGFAGIYPARIFRLDIGKEANLKAMECMAQSEYETKITLGKTFEKMESIDKQSLIFELPGMQVRELIGIAEEGEMIVFYFRSVRTQLGRLLEQT